MKLNSLLAFAALCAIVSPSLPSTLSGVVSARVEEGNATSNPVALESNPRAVPEYTPTGDPLSHPQDGQKTGQERDRETLTATDPQVARILDLLDGTYRKLTTYQADFEQESETKTLQLQRRSSGRMYFRKPDQMRWSYHEPEVREVYLLGEQMFIHVPERNLVMKQALGDTLPGIAPARLFMGVQHLRESFLISLAPEARQQPDAYGLRLVPKKKSGISAEEIFLWLNKKDLLPVRSESQDVLGNVTRLSFRNGKANASLKDDLFRFEIPEGAEVVEDNY